MGKGVRPSVDAVPVAEQIDIRRRGRGDVRRRIGFGFVALVCVAAVAIPVVLHATGENTRREIAPATKRHVDLKQARIEVGAALAATVAARSYRIVSVLSETDPPGYTEQRGLTLSAQATVNVDPYAIVATSNIAGLGPITSWTDGTRQWEQGGGNYGINAPRASTGPGAPISGFTSLVVGSLGPREGGVAMMGLSSPYGYLDLADSAITGASQTGTTTLNGAVLTEYEVILDAAQLVHLPGMSSEQIQAASDGLALLQNGGYTHTTVRIGIDAAGYVRQSRTTFSFADGGVVTADVSYYDFGCAGTVVLPTVEPAPPPTPTCTSDPSATTPTTTTPVTQTTVAGSTADAGAAAISYAYEHFFDPRLPADQRFALIQGSAAMRDWILAVSARHEAEAAAGAIIVDAITVNGNVANVSFHALYQGRESPANPGQLSGTAVLEDGTWKISRTTYCTLSANDGEPCPRNN